MAVNLTPQYLEAEAAYKKAQTAAERLTCLQTMYKLVPKHKASEKLQAELKTKISDAKEAAETEKKASKGTGVSAKIPKQGAGQVVILGGPNAGKSRLLSRLTRATPEVAAFPFTTREPTPGMMDVLDVRVQLIDLPPVTADYLEGYVTSLTRSADAALLVLDLGDDDGPFAAQAVIEKLAETKTQLVGEQTPSDTPAVAQVRTLLVATKLDAAGAAERLEIGREMFPGFPTVAVDAEHGSLDELRAAIFQRLDVVRVYTKEPGKPADKTSPYTVPRGSTVVAVAGKVHKDFADALKSARVWGSGAFDGQTVKRDHVVGDGDVVELQV